LLEPHSVEQNHYAWGRLRGVAKKDEAPKRSLNPPSAPARFLQRFSEEDVSLSVFWHVHRNITEAEQVEKIADCRRIVRHILVGRAHNRVGHIIPAAA
jgi:hypothetical protein